LMQDRISQIDENLLPRTAGPYIRVIHDTFGPRVEPAYRRSSSEAAQIRDGGPACQGAMP
jgi:hypothetical protein